MDLDLYKGQILEFASSIPRVGRLDAPDASASASRGEWAPEEAFTTCCELPRL